MDEKPVYQAIAASVAALANCRTRTDEFAADWIARHTETAEQLTRYYMPSGSGFDAGTTINLEESTAERLVFETSFHHMNDSGMYDGWTSHNVIVTPSLLHGFALRITGRDKRGIKDYIAESFSHALSQMEGVKAA